MASSPEIRKIRRSRFPNFQQITMPSLAALTPSHWQVEHIDEEVRPVDFDVQADLIRITFHTPARASFDGRLPGVKLTGLLPQVGFQVKVREYHQQFLFPSEVILAQLISLEEIRMPPRKHRSRP